MKNKIVIVISEFNKKISDNLLDGATSEYIKNGGNIKNIQTYWVQGAFEIPGTIKQVLEHKKDINGVLALGCVIKGETAHFEYISSSVSNAISKISYHEKTKIPIIFGILTTYTYDEALSRSHPLKKNKGAEVMNALLQTMCIYYKIQK